MFLIQQNNRNSYSNQQPNCLGFDLTLEYVPRKISAQWETTIDINSLVDGSAATKFEVLSILPS